MCDYSLYAIQNRIAEEGEEVVLHKFKTGTLGFTSLHDLIRFETTAKTKACGFWSTLKDCLLPRTSSPLPAICIAPGTRLLLTDVPRKLQISVRIGSSEVVAFTEISERSYSYRDALVLQNGTRVLLQDLPEGLHALILSMSTDAEVVVPVRKRTELRGPAA
jgi:hypothetical protein